MSRHLCPKRQLTGFGDPLDWRPLDFVDRIPYVFCCALCGVVPAFPKRLMTCCHVFCPSCFERIVEEQCVCPIDGSLFAEHSVEALDSNRGGVNELRAHCPNATHGCTFVGMLSDIKEHFMGSCDYSEVHCPRCGLAIIQRTALYHYRQECDAVRKVEPAVSDVEAESSSEGVCHTSSSSRRSRSHGKSASGKGLGKPKRSGARGVPSVENAGKEKSPIITATRSLLQDNPSSCIVSASVGSSGAPSTETSLMNRGGFAAKGDRRKAARASKSADGALTTSLSETQLLERVDSMVTMQRKKTESDSAPVTAEASSSDKDCTKAPSRTATTSAAAAAAESPQAAPHDVAKKTSFVAPAGFAFCYVTDLADAESHLVCGEELILRSDSSQLADCAFRVHARLRRDADGSVLVCFTLFLCGGMWRRVADWALSTKICLVLVHPWDQAQNMRLPLCPNPAALPPPKGAHAGRWDFWSPTNELKLRNLATRGFVSSGAVCVAVEIQ